ncbi:MAG: hypothetical protein ACRDT6_07595 [Micromonosporaceae bacterium]
MSDWLQSIVDVEVRDGDAVELAEKLRAWLIETGILVAELDDEGHHRPGPRHAEAYQEPSDQEVDGGEFVVRRHWYDGLDPATVTCAGCGAATPLHDEHYVDNEAGDAMYDAAQAWLGGAGHQSCGHCGHVNGLNDWTWAPPNAFGALGITFWGWPPLSTDFVDRVGELRGHRVVYVPSSL